MPIALFEVLSALIIALSLVAMAQARPWRALLLEYAILAHEWTPRGSAT